MYGPEKHIIEKVHFKIHSESLEHAHHLKENLSDVLNSIFIPYIEKYFDDMFPDWKNQIIRIEKLKISLNVGDVIKDFSEVTSTLKKELDSIIHELVAKNEIDTSLNDAASTDNQKIIQPVQRKFDALVYFLRTGRSPWWLNSKELDAFLEEKELVVFLNTNKKYVLHLLSAMKNDARVRARISAQFSSRFLFSFLYTVANNDHEIRSSEHTHFKKIFTLLNKKQRELFLSILLEFIDSLATVKDQKQGWNKPFIAFVEEIVGSKDRRSETKSLVHDVHQIILALSPTELLELPLDIHFFEEKTPVIDDQPQKTENLEDKEDDLELLEKGLFVENAGLIIMHPFFPHFFQNIGVLDEEKNIIQPDLAVQVLHYIATGKENDWEHNLLFEKFLCGIPLTETMNRSVSLSEEFKQEVDELFASLVDHWSILKNSSADLIRYEYLTRNGKLFKDDVSARLVIERKTQDILIDKLPWGISILKFPWTTNILYSTW